MIEVFMHEVRLCCVLYLSIINYVNTRIVSSSCKINSTGTSLAELIDKSTNGNKYTKSNSVENRSNGCTEHKLRI